MNHEIGQTNVYGDMTDIYWNKICDKKIIPVKLTPIIQKAINIASEKHLGQKRKADGLPYIVHPLETVLCTSCPDSKKGLDRCSSHRSTPT